MTNEMNLTTKRVIKLVYKNINCQKNFIIYHVIL